MYSVRPVVAFGVVFVAFAAGTWVGRTRSTTASPSPAPVSQAAPMPQGTGIEVSAVTPRSGILPLRALGRVEADESRMFRINAGIDGIIKSVAPIVVGSRVRKGQTLAAFASPGALPALQLFILNSGTAERARLGPTAGQNALALSSSNLRQRADQLDVIGVSPEQQEEIASSQLFPDSIRIVAPVDGVVLSRNVAVGTRFDKGSPFFEIARLDHVAVFADFSEAEVRQVGTVAHVMVAPRDGGQPIEASLAPLLPTADVSTGRLRLRLDVPNTDARLVPGMLADVDLHVPYDGVVAIPLDALTLGEGGPTVFVEVGDGRYEPRRVATGWRADGLVEIRSGLTVGERIVVRGTALVDAVTPATGGATPATPAQHEHQHGQS